MQGFPHQVVIDCGSGESEGHVLADCPLNEGDILWDVRDGSGPLPDCILGRDAADEHLTYLGLKHSQYHIGKC